MREIKPFIYSIVNDGQERRIEIQYIWRVRSRSGNTTIAQRRSFVVYLFIFILSAERQKSELFSSLRFIQNENDESFKSRKRASPL